ncbi:MAG: uridine monophosphate kinase [Planctomycetes bacterium]|nr:uridine monophosphate kinase [Planctomycetota bacterium]
MGREPAERRVLLKLSGGVFSGRGDKPFQQEALSFIAEELAAALQRGSQLAVVLGGGNMIRGAALVREGEGRLLADYAGMFATAVNVLVLRAQFLRRGVPASHYCAIEVGALAEKFSRARCIQDMEGGKVVLLAGGTGNPLFTTDTAAALRAVELGAGLLLKATRVDGVYSADPEKDPGAERFERLSYQDVLERRLAVMDLAAISLCMEHSIPIRVFDYSVRGNIGRAIAGENIGTLIGSQ